MGPDFRTMIGVSYGEPVETRPDEYSERELKEAMGDILKDFKGVINLNGNKAVYYIIQIATEGGEGYIRHMVQLYNADITAQYSINLEYSSDDKFFTSDVVNQIINSITLAPEAQHLEGKGEM